MTRQFVAVKFKPEDKRAFTYHNDGPPVAVGDMIAVPGRSGGQIEREVLSIVDEKPLFDTKAIIGRVEPKEEGNG